LKKNLAGFARKFPEENALENTRLHAAEDMNCDRHPTRRDLITEKPTSPNISPGK